MRIGPLRLVDRARLAEILVATAAFNADEVNVALSLFDVSGESLGGGAAGADAASADYEFRGAFDAADRLAGYACFGATPGTDGTWDLYWLAVDPVAQGQGIGRALLRAVEDELGGRGARMLVAETSGRADYAPTRAFYLATGYAEAARVRDFYAPADDRIMLHRRLTMRERGVARR